VQPGLVAEPGEQEQDVTLSTRPAVLLGGYDGEWRRPFTFDYEFAHGLSLFGGADAGTDQ
jgi:hypothetical protein